MQKLLQGRNVSVKDDEEAVFNKIML